MFSIKYSEIDPFVTPQADIAMRKIYGNDFVGDFTALAVARALLFERLGQDERFEINMKILNVWSDGSTLDADACLDATFTSPRQNCYHVVNIVHPQLYERLSTPITSQALAEEKRYRLIELTKISDYLRHKVKLETRIFINEDRGAAYIMGRNLSPRHLHLITSLFPRYVPKFFAEKPLKPIEREMLETMTRQSGRDFLAAMSRVGAEMNMREMLLRNVVKDFEKREMQRLLENATAHLRSLRMEVEAAMNSYVEAVERHQNQMYRVEGLKAGTAKTGDNSELLEYLINNKNVDVVRMVDNKIEIEIRTFMDIFDVEIWKRYAANGSVYAVYDVGSSVFQDEQNRRMFLDALFSENAPLRLKLRGYFRLDLSGRCSTDNYHLFGSACDDYMTNPHFHYHACLGQNATQISAQLTRGEIIGAIECAIASCKAVNLAELTQTVRPMINKLLDSHEKIIRTADGVDRTPEEALQWLKEQNQDA